MNYALNGSKRRSRTVVGVVGVGLVLAFTATAYYVQSPYYQSRQSEIVVTSAAKPKPIPEGITTNLQFVGDVFWGRGIQMLAQRSAQSYQHITSGLSAADRAKYDAWIANFECPITTKDVPYSLQVSALKFNCRPEYLPELAKWFTAASQANNHTDNNDGDWGLEQTQSNLQTAHIQNFGTYDMGQVGDLCEVITVPAHTTKTSKLVGLPVALCGYMYVVDVTPTDAQLAVMRQYAKVMPVIAMPHMGVEYRTTAEQAKVTAYRRMIDNGADVVIGAHPHVIQNSENYKGRLIAYSLGNFLFDQQSLGRDTTLGLAVDLSLTVDDGKTAQLYESIAPSCQVYKDDCLAELTAKLPERPQITINYKFQCYDESSGVPTLGSDAVCDLARSAATVDQLSGLATSW
ncbi:MAG: CapA family protein [Candidatus Saccharimonadales bacterium]